MCRDRHAQSVAAVFSRVDPLRTRAPHGAKSKSLLVAVPMQTATSFSAVSVSERSKTASSIRRAIGTLRGSYPSVCGHHIELFDHMQRRLDCQALVARFP
jgi:hypothetical protein